MAMGLFSLGLFIAERNKFLFPNANKTNGERVSSDEPYRSVLQHQECKNNDNASNSDRDFIPPWCGSSTTHWDQPISSKPGMPTRRPNVEPSFTNQWTHQADCCQEGRHRCLCKNCCDSQNTAELEGRTPSGLCTCPPPSSVPSCPRGLMLFWVIKTSPCTIGGEWLFRMYRQAYKALGTPWWKQNLLLHSHLLPLVVRKYELSCASSQNLKTSSEMEEMMMVNFLGSQCFNFLTGCFSLTFGSRRPSDPTPLASQGMVGTECKGSVGSMTSAEGGGDFSSHQHTLLLGEGH